MAGPAETTSGTLTVLLPTGAAKAVPWLLDAPGERHQSGTALLLLHGASGDAGSGNLPALAAAAAAAGCACLRITARSSSLDHRVAVTKARCAAGSSLGVELRRKPGSVRAWRRLQHRAPPTDPQLTDACPPPPARRRCWPRRARCLAWRACSAGWLAGTQWVQE